MRKTALICAAVLTAAAGGYGAPPAHAAGYDGTVRTYLTSAPGRHGVRYTARYTVTNTTDTARKAAVRSPSVPGLECSVVVPARSSATCTASTDWSVARRWITVAPDVDSRLGFASAARALNRVGVAPKPGPTYPDHCYDPYDDYSYFDCGDPDPDQISIFWDDTSPWNERMTAGKPYHVWIVIGSQDWKRNFVADISSPRFATDSGRQVEPEQRAQPGDPLEVRHYPSPGYVYEVLVTPTREEAAQRTMRFPVTLTSTKGTVYTQTIVVPG